MALVPTLNSGLKTFVANDRPRKDEVHLEGANYARLAAEREAVIRSMEAKQANLINMEHLEDQARRLRQVQRERGIFQRDEHLHNRFNEDRLRALNLEDSKLRTSDQMARDEERRLRARRSHAELEWARERERQRREDELFRHRVRSFGGGHPPLPPPRSRHDSGMLMPYRPPNAAPHLLPPPAHHHPAPHHHSHGLPFPRPRHQSYAGPSYPALPPPHHGHITPRPPPRRRTSSMGAFDRRPPMSVPGTPHYHHPAPAMMPPRGRRLSEPDLMHGMVRRPSYRL